MRVECRGLREHRGGGANPGSRTGGWGEKIMMVISKGEQEFSRQRGRGGMFRRG